MNTPEATGGLGRPLRSALFGAWRGWTGALSLLGLLYLAAYLVVYATRPAGASGVELLSDFGEEPLEVLGVVLALVVIHREARVQARLAWGLIALGLAANLIGNVVYGAYDLAGQQPFPSVADAFYLSFYVCMFAGLLVYPTASVRREVLNWRVWSNVAIVVVGGGMVLLHFVLLPTVQDLGSDPLGAAISLAYPAGDLALLTALATIATRRPYAVDRLALGGFMVAVSAWFFADVAFAIEGSSYTSGSVSDLIWLAGDVAFLLAAQGHLLRLPHPDGGVPSAPLSIGRLGPYGMLGAGLATLVSAAIATGAEIASLAWLAMFLTGLVVARQLIDEHERRVAEAALLAEQAGAASHAAQQARHDVLTGLPNRMRLAELLAAELGASRLTGRPVTLAFLDLNGFKDVNDSLGHAAGDRLLVEVAHRLEASARAGDTVVRLGGDEFAIVLPGANGEHALLATERIMRDLERPVDMAGVQVSISGAIGLATYPQSGAVDDDALMQQADTAMYQAKRGHLGPTTYDPSLETKAPTPAGVRVDAASAAATRRRARLSGHPDAAPS